MLLAIVQSSVKLQPSLRNRPFLPDSILYSSNFFDSDNFSTTWPSLLATFTNSYQRLHLEQTVSDDSGWKTVPTIAAIGYW
jgi:hypothetical protein